MEAPYMGVTYRMIVCIPTMSHYIDGASDRLGCGWPVAGHGRTVAVGWPFGENHG